MPAGEPKPVVLPAGMGFTVSEVTAHLEPCQRCGKGDRACLPYSLGRGPAWYRAVLCTGCANEWDDFILDHYLWEDYEYAEELRRFYELLIMGRREGDDGRFRAVCSAQRAAARALRTLARDWLAGKEPVTGSAGAAD